MSNDLDRWLNSIGLENSSSNDAQNDAQPSNEPQSLSTQDFDDILGSFGFSQPEEIQAEEIHEENGEGEVGETTEEYNENGGESRDLNTERDTAWQEAIDSGGVVPVEPDNQIHFHMPDGNVIDVPILTEEEDARQAQEFDAVPQEEPLIPLNSPTLLMDESTTRFSGAEWFNEIQKKDIALAGIGGIGSWTAIQLARLNPHGMFLYDSDSVEAVNMAGQFYERDDISRNKASAIADKISRYTNSSNIHAIESRFTETTGAARIMICGFDNMESRRNYFNAWYNFVSNLSEEEKKECLFIDGRLSINVLQVLCFTGNDTENIGRYVNSYLFSDEEADEVICSMKQTTYLACMIGSIITNLFVNFCASLLDPIIPYDLPFFTEYDAQNMIFKTIK